MNVNDHSDVGDDENALKKKRLEKVEDAIMHAEKTLADLRDVRDALLVELGLPPPQQAVPTNNTRSFMSKALNEEMKRKRKNK